MPSKTFFYHPQARLRVANVSHLEGQSGHNWDLKVNGDGDPNARVPVNAAYKVSVMLPAVEPLNLIPLDTRLASGLLVHVMVFKATDLGHALFHLRAGVGKPTVAGNHPQRKSKHHSKKGARVQEFDFPAGNFTPNDTVVFLFQSLHRFFDDRNGNDGVPFEEARFVVKQIQRRVAAA